MLYPLFIAIVYEAVVSRMRKQNDLCLLEYVSIVVITSSTQSSLYMFIVALIWRSYFGVETYRGGRRVRRPSNKFIVFKQ